MPFEYWVVCMRVKDVLKLVRNLVILVVLAAAGVVAYKYYMHCREVAVLKQIIERLTADTRIAEVLVTDVKAEPNSGRELTTIKFVEYDSKGLAIEPRYFTFSGNIIQFQSMVIRFDERYVKYGDRLRGKSAYVFLKAFALHDNGRAEVFAINDMNEAPSGYRIAAAKNGFERQLWLEFWKLALEPAARSAEGVKNAQIEAPGTRFVPGMLYTIKIEHDGGMRIDSAALPAILSGERIPAAK
jgi:hypothetical protein